MGIIHKDVEECNQRHERIPDYRCNDDFDTRFAPKRGPGFFPGTEGYFHRCSTTGPVEVVFFGTDFGTQRYWEDEVEDGDGESKDQKTVSRVRSLVENAGVDPCSCYLTNAVLGLAKFVPGKVEKNTDTHRAYRKAKHPLFFQECAKSHREWLARHQPRLAVLMGAGHFRFYRSIWFEVWPKLFGAPDGVWHGVTSMAGAFSRSRQEVDPVSGVCVQLMYHPTSWGEWWKFRAEAVDDLRTGLGIQASGAGSRRLG